jgi:hypothetical protein
VSYRSQPVTKFERCTKLKKPHFQLPCIAAILIDEQIGRTITSARNLPVSGTLGILERADTMDLLGDFPQILFFLQLSGIGTPGIRPKK